jgi:hopanoid biosynthesis associated protein HpnK
MLRLIVHADDFGLSQPINEGIRLAHAQGIVTSTSLMANGAAFEHAINICLDTPTLDVGIHLTLVEDRPVLPADTVPSLVDGTGRFHRHATVLARQYLTGKICLEHVRAELEAQIERVMDYGVRITHLDGHQHAHMLPQILRITIELARKYGIAHVRSASERMRSYMLWGGGGLTRLPQLLGLNALALLGRDASSRHIDHFVGFFFGGKLTKSNLLTLIKNLPQTGTCELMCHPGFDDPTSAHVHWGYRWSEELRALVDMDVIRSLGERDVELISYRHLMQS